MLPLIKRILSDETGASAAEYAVLTGLVIIALVAAITYYTNGLNTLFNALGTKMSDVGGSL